MRFTRIVPVALAGTLLVATTLPASAQTTPKGAGTSTTSLTALVVDAGSLLGLDVLTDLGKANNDSAAGSLLASAQLEALTLESALAGLEHTVPVVSVSSSGDAQETNEEIAAVDNPVLAGSFVPVVLRAAVDELGAVSGEEAGVAGLDVLGGVLGLDSIDIGLDTLAGTDKASATHGLSVDSLDALDLAALLGGLGISLSDLSLDTVLGLVDSLGLLDELGVDLEALGLAGIDPANLSVESITAALGGLTDEIGLLDGLSADLTETVPVCDVADPAIDLLGQLTGTDSSTLCNDVAATVADTTAQLVDLESLLGDALNAPLALLDDAALLSLDGLDVSILTTATDDVSTSVADVVASIGSIEAAGLALPGIDLGAVTDQVTSTLDQATGAIGTVLGTIDPRLADLVTVDTLAETTSVTEDAGTVTSAVDFTGLVVKVVPDVAELVDIITGLAGVESLGDQLGALGLPVPGIPADIASVNSLLAGLPTSGLTDAGAVYALSEGFTVEVASVSQTSSFTPGATPATPAAPLPRTGSSDAVLLLLGGLAAAAALGIRRLSPARS